MLTSPSTSALGLYNNNFYIGPKNYDSYDVKTYVFPLASRAYGGSSVPLNRFDNIRLVLSFSKDVKATSVNVTCVGETTSLFKGGASSLAMY